MKQRQWIECSCTEVVGMSDAHEHVLQGHTITQCVLVEKELSFPDVLVSPSFESESE